MRIVSSSLAAAGNRHLLRRAGLAVLTSALVAVSGCAQKVADGTPSAGARATASVEPLSSSPPTPYVPNGDAPPPYRPAPYRAPYKPYEPPAARRTDAKPADSRPAATPSRAATTTATGSAVVVEKGDTLTNLARRHNVKVDDLKKANNLTSDTIKIGQSLTVPRT